MAHTLYWPPEQLELLPIPDSDPPVDGGFAKARRVLRDEQRRYAEAVAHADDHTPLQVARRMAEIREQEASLLLAHTSASGPSPSALVDDDGLFYFASTERRRWQRTRDIIERVRPGPGEDGVLFEQLARQAASIELTIGQADDTLGRVLIGTTGRPISKAYAQQIGDCAIIVISAGMVYLIQRAAECLNLASTDDEDHRYRFSTTADLAKVRRHLEDDPTAIELLRETLFEWLFAGVARRPVPLLTDGQTFATELIQSFAHRFVLAHEYGHVFKDLLRHPEWIVTTADPADVKEVQADAEALQRIGHTSLSVDRVAPNVALTGAVLAIKARELLERAVAIAKGRPDAERQALELFDRRVALVVEIYRTLLAPDADDTDLDVEPMVSTGKTLELLWAEIEPQLRQRLEGGERLHHIWW